MTYRVIFDAKISIQDQTVVFDFTGKLSPGETIPWAVVATDVYSGEDLAPSAILSGSPVIEGAKVSQELTGGVVGVTYKLACQIETSLYHSHALLGYVSVIGVMS